MRGGPYLAKESGRTLGNGEKRGAFVVWGGIKHGKEGGERFHSQS